MWDSPSLWWLTTSLLACLVMACRPTPRSSALLHAFSHTNQPLSTRAMRHKTPSTAPRPSCPQLLWRHLRPLNAPASRSPPSHPAASRRWMPLKTIWGWMALMGTTMGTGPCPGTTCICPWTTHIETLRSALAHAAASPLGAGSLMLPPVNRSHTSMMMLTQSLMKRLPGLPWDPLSLPQVVPLLKPLVELWRSSPTGSSNTLLLSTSPTQSPCHPGSPPVTHHAPVSLMKIG